MKKIILVIVLAVAWRTFYYIPTATNRDSGVQVYGQPYQSNNSAASFKLDKYLITPKAEFMILGRILAASRHYFDKEARISPLDLTLGWGPMSDNKVLDQMEIWQEGRRYKWSADSLPIPKKEIESNSANMHLIPANDEIAKALKEIRIGTLVTIEGMLVDASENTGWKWKTSTTRTDTGQGAAEIIYVTSISEMNPYE
ncbi:MAG: hypothetical protein ISEC1_P1233 [Thiomicrorhabdus sp.]|nr:MAG: hypothetical protein ISEC1_P1233 [Thiomicrorhabdus sp.]